MKRKTFFKKAWPFLAVALFLGLMVVFIQPLLAKDIQIAPEAADKLGIGTVSPSVKLDVVGDFKAYNTVFYSGEMTTATDYPTCTSPARIYTIATVNANGSNYSNIEIEVIGSHRGYTSTSYVEKKKWVIWVGDKISSNLIESSGAQNNVGLWNGVDTTGFSNATAAGTVIKLIVNPSCGAGVTYRVNVRYTSDLNITIPTSRFSFVDHTAYTVSIPQAPFHVFGTIAYMPGNVGIGTTAPGYKLDVRGTGRFTGALIVPTPSASSHAATKGYVDSVAGTGGISGSGTTNYIPKWSSASGLTNSRISDTGTGNVVVSAVLQATSFSGNATSATNADYATNAGYAASAGTAGALSSTSLCSSGYYARGITTSGTASGCTAVPTGGHGDGTNCSTGYFATGVDASGNAQGCANSIANSTNADYATNAGYAASAGTAGALSSTSLCSSGYYARGITTSGTASGCTAVPTGGHGNGTNCSAGYYARGVDASGNAEDCTAVPTGGHSNGANCAAGSFPLGVDANGAAESCTSLTNGGFSPAFGTVTATSYLYSSDAKLKTNIKTIKKPLEKITALRGVTFKWKDSKEPSMGLIAQEVEKVFPELVETSGQYKAVEYGNLVAPLIEAVKAQQVQIEALEARIADLESNR